LSAWNVTGEHYLTMRFVEATVCLHIQKYSISSRQCVCVCHLIVTHRKRRLFSHPQLTNGPVNEVSACFIWCKNWVI